MGEINLVTRSKFVTCKNLPLRDYYEKRNRVLVLRDTGGLGDILMLRMLFQDIKESNPDAEIVVAVPPKYKEAIQDHPYIDEIIDSQNVDLSAYVLSYNVTSACGRYEERKAPLADLHRADIWAKHCGLELKHHEMHFSISNTVRDKCLDVVRSYRTGSKPLVIFSPLSAMPSKNLDTQQSQAVIDGLRLQGCDVVLLHTKTIKDLDAPTVGGSIIDFLGFINIADYIISVDTATFHAGGGMDKPMVGIFTWADGKVYGKWFKRWLLVQRHRDDGNWDCGPCYMWYDCPLEQKTTRKPCVTSLTSNEILEKTDQMMKIWPV